MHDWVVEVLIFIVSIIFGIIAWLLNRNINNMDKSIAKNYTYIDKQVDKYAEDRKQQNIELAEKMKEVSLKIDSLNVLVHQLEKTQAVIGSQVERFSEFDKELKDLRTTVTVIDTEVKHWGNVIRKP